MRCLCFSITLCVQQSPSEWLAGIRIEKFTPRFSSSISQTFSIPVCFAVAWFFGFFILCFLCLVKKKIMDHQHSNYCFWSKTERKMSAWILSFGTVMLLSRKSVSFVPSSKNSSSKLESYHGNLWLSHFCGTIMLLLSLALRVIYAWEPFEYVSLDFCRWNEREKKGV